SWDAESRIEWGDSYIDEVLKQISSDPKDARVLVKPLAAPLPFELGPDGLDRELRSRVSQFHSILVKVLGMKNIQSFRKTSYAKDILLEGEVALEKLAVQFYTQCRSRPPTQADIKGFVTRMTIG